MKKFQTLIICLFLAAFSQAQDRSIYEKQLFVLGTDTLPCRILTPVNYKPGKKYPLVVFLHGSGERGNDNEKQLSWGADLFMDSINRARYPAIVVFPQCPITSSWARTQRSLKDSLVFGVNSDTAMTNPMHLILSFIDTLVAAGRVDKKRIYMGGLSMGGFGTFDAIARRPALFAAAFPICGGGDPNGVKKYKKGFPIWVFHGGADPVVPVSNSRFMVGELKKKKAKVKYTEYPGVGHDSWKNAFAEPELLAWLFSKKS